MPTDLLASKLFIPPLRASLVPRPRLIEVELLPSAELALNIMLISEGIYLSEQLGREVTADEVREKSVSLSTPN
jgi:hypothetical protein